MVPSSAHIVVQNRRISLSATSAIPIGDVENNIFSLQRALVSGDQNIFSKVFLVIARLPTHLENYISQRMNHVVRSDAT